MICYHFPPLGGIASLRVLRFAQNLPEFGWEPLILAPERPAGARDPNLVFDESRVVRAVNFSWSGAGAQLGGDTPGLHGASAAGMRGRVRAFARRWLYFPDGYIGWYPGAVSAGRRLLREQRVDALFSSAYPMTGHLIARRLRRDSGLPWVADFRDLWSEWSQETPLRRAREQALEQSFLGEADAVTTVSPSYAEQLTARGARRSVLVTNGYDDSSAAPELEIQPHVAYLGSYYPGYQDHVVTGFEALAHLRKEGYPELRLLFVGRFPEALRAPLAQVGLADASEATGFIPHADAVRYLRRARVLLMAGPEHARTPEVRGHIAAKVFEYLAARRPVLVIGDPASDVARLLQPFTRARVVAPRDVAAATLALRELLAWEPGAAEPSFEEFSGRSLTARLAGLLDRLVDKA